MADGYDGSVKINTKLNTKGFAKGMDDLKQKAGTAFAILVDKAYAAVQGIKSAFSKIGSAIGSIFKKLLVGALLLFALSARRIVEDVKQSITDALNLPGNEALKAKVDGIKSQFEELRMSVAIAFLPLIELAIPYIQRAIDWLIKAVNYVSMVIAAFTGAKTVMQVVAGSAAKLAANTKDAKKAAEGALAAFDQINVLQMDKGTPDTVAPTVETQMVPITQDILDKVQTIKDLWAKLWSDPLPLIQAAWNIFKDWFMSTVVGGIKAGINGVMDALFPPGSAIRERLINPLSVGFFTLIESTKTLFKGMWDVITNDSLTTSQKLEAINTLFIDWLKVNVTDNLISLFKGAWDSVSGIVAAALAIGIQKLIEFGVWIKLHIDKIIADFQAAGKAIWTFFGDIGAVIISILGKVGDLAAAAWKGLISIFGAVGDFVFNTSNSILRSIDNLINSIIEKINGLIALANTVPGLNIPAIPNVGGGGSAGGRVPHLANGAVIPGGNPFLAMLGDQRPGQTNVETPVDLLRQIIREEMGSGDTTANLTVQLDGAVIYKNQQRIKTSRGKSLLAGGSI